jgi:hypothetical protein
MLSSLEIIRLYRDILKHATKYPSIKRKKIITEIKVGFRASKNETDKLKIQEGLMKAIKGLDQLKMYTMLPKGSPEWSVQLEENPIPKRY